LLPMRPGLPARMTHATTTSAMARPVYLPPWRSPAARCAVVVIRFILISNLSLS
jgi:hypothetical protein